MLSGMSTAAGADRSVAAHAYRIKTLNAYASILDITQITQSRDSVSTSESIREITGACACRAGSGADVDGALRAQCGRLVYHRWLCVQTILNGPKTVNRKLSIPMGSLRFYRHGTRPRRAPHARALSPATSLLLFYCRRCSGSYTSGNGLDSDAVSARVSPRRRRRRRARVGREARRYSR
ncbi:hypothetical protein EVAR_20841_1 [Eumeta japonica]|uniref:Uncharacterized protein n=1 Tax=Eumeta variegata TaxID=151549 RepID=A0A4C1UEI2_EUMVA|nr:hypothetical protein EVAR_20841_1 [Eumeta japonica]